MADYIITIDGLLNTEYLEHHGVKGMKWGVRRNKVTEGLKNNNRTGSNLERSINEVAPKTLQKGKDAISRLNLNIQLFANKKEFKGRAHRMPKAVSIAMTDASYKERNSPAFTRVIDGYEYLFINRPGDYPIYKKLHKATKTIHEKKKDGD